MGLIVNIGPFEIFTLVKAFTLLLKIIATVNV